jgi:hypothetical protein
MRNLHETELFREGENTSTKSAITQAINNQLNQGTGVIVPKHIESELASVKLKAKKSIGLLSEGISLYEGFNGRIRLFNLGLTSGGRSPIPAYMPFVISKARNKQLESEMSSGNNITSPAVYMNLYRIGHFSKDESEYQKLNAATDLAALLDSGATMYRMVYQGGHEQLLDNSVVLENLTRIYTSLFAGAVSRASKVGVYGSEFNTDAARYIIAKFFLLYVLKKPLSKTIEEYAHKAIKGRTTSLVALKNFEDNNEIDYTKLSSFLESFGYVFFDNPINLSLFHNSWLVMYGEGLSLAVEYVPYLFHFLIALKYGATLGGSTRLYNTSRYADLVKDGLVKLLNTVSTVLR